MCKAGVHQVVHDDPLLHVFAEMILDGWPEDLQSCPMPILPYWDHHDVLRIEGRIILHRKANVVPLSQGQDVLRGMHGGHWESQSANCKPGMVITGHISLWTWSNQFSQRDEPMLLPSVGLTAAISDTNTTASMTNQSTDLFHFDGCVLLCNHAEYYAVSIFTSLE